MTTNERYGRLYRSPYDNRIYMTTNIDMDVRFVTNGTGGLSDTFNVDDYMNAIHTLPMATDNSTFDTINTQDNYIEYRGGLGNAVVGRDYMGRSYEFICVDDPMAPDKLGEDIMGDYDKLMKGGGGGNV